MVTLRRKSPINYIKIRKVRNKIATCLYGRFEILGRIALIIIARVTKPLSSDLFCGCRFPPPVKIGEKCYPSSMNLMNTCHPG